MTDPIQLSQSLIACRSITPKDAGALAVLGKALKSLKFKVEEFTFEEPGCESVKNLFAKFGDGGKHLCFAGHTDVVPPGDETEWTSQPFEPTIRDNMLYGRGAADMKCAIACFVAACSRFLEGHKDFDGSISLLITGDEEGDAINGTKKLLEALSQKGERFDGCIVGEPTNPENLGDMIKIGRRGSISFTIELFGTQGHVAYPHLADNPISRLNKILHSLDLHTLDDGTEYFDPSNLEITSFDVGNTAGNVIPSMAKATFNIRYNDSHKPKTLVKWVEGICDSVCHDGSAKYELHHRNSAEPFITPPGELSDVVSQSVAYVTTITPKLSTTGGTSDARFIKDYCPVVEFGLINQTAHKVDECAKLDDIEHLTQIYEQVLERYFL